MACNHGVTPAWVEVNENDGPSNPYPFHGRVYLTNFLYDIRLVISERRDEDPWQVETGLWRAADLSGATSAKVNFIYRRTSLEAGDYLAVQASTDGGNSWTEAGRIDYHVYDSDWQIAEFDLTPFISPDFAIRFLSHYNENGTDYYDNMYLDNIQITHNGGESPAEGNPTLVEANELHMVGIDGAGVTVAVVDTGIWAHTNIASDVGYYGPCANSI